VLFRRLPQSPYLVLSALGRSTGWEKKRVDNASNLELAEIASVFVRFDHVASFIVNAN